MKLNTEQLTRGFLALTDHVNAHFDRLASAHNQLASAHNQLVGEVAERTQDLAGWLEEHDPSDLAHAQVIRRLTKRIEMLERICTVNGAHDNS